MLARRRERLNRRQLFAAYPAQAGTAFFRAPGAPPPWPGRALLGRQLHRPGRPDGRRRHTRFGFNTDPASTPGETGERLFTPNPRLVSRVLMTRKDGCKASPF